MALYAADALYTRPLSSLSAADIDTFGGKNTALGEMIRHMATAGLWAPQGFALSTGAFTRFVHANGIHHRITGLLAALQPDGSNGAEIGAAIRAAILSSGMPADLRQEIVAHYRILLEDVADWPLPVAVSASIVPERLTEAGFGGRQPASHFVQSAETLLDAVRRSYAALYGDRAIAYRLANAVPHDAVKISIAVQTMVWANAGGRARDIDEAGDEILAISSFTPARRRAG